MEDEKRVLNVTGQGNLSVRAQRGSMAAVDILRCPNSLVGFPIRPDFISDECKCALMEYNKATRTHLGSDASLVELLEFSQEYFERLALEHQIIYVSLDDPSSILAALRIAVPEYRQAEVDDLCIEEILGSADAQVKVSAAGIAPAVELRLNRVSTSVPTLADKAATSLAKAGLTPHVYMYPNRKVPGVSLRAHVGGEAAHSNSGPGWLVTEGNATRLGELLARTHLVRAEGWLGTFNGDVWAAAEAKRGYPLTQQWVSTKKDVEEALSIMSKEPWSCFEKGFVVEALAPVLAVKRAVSGGESDKLAEMLEGLAEDLKAKLLKWCHFIYFMLGQVLKMVDEYGLMFRMVLSQGDCTGQTLLQLEGGGLMLDEVSAAAIQPACMDLSRMLANFSAEAPDTPYPKRNVRAKLVEAYKEAMPAEIQGKKMLLTDELLLDLELGVLLNLLTTSTLPLAQGFESGWQEMWLRAGFVQRGFDALRKARDGDDDIRDRVIEGGLKAFIFDEEPYPGTTPEFLEGRATNWFRGLPL